MDFKQPVYAEEIPACIRLMIKYLNDRTKEYDEGHPTISDKEWDDAYFKLSDLEKASSIYFNDSPTQNISFNVVDSLKKVSHNHDMLSLEKTKSLDDIKVFLKDEPYIIMSKLDGLTCSLKYENGVLVSAETRGNGKIGEDILHNAMVIPSIPKEIPYKETLIIDGEVLCSYDDFEPFSQLYKNPRNFAAGSIRLLDSKECRSRNLKFVAWEVIEGLNDYETLSQKLLTLLEYGFAVVPTGVGKSSPDLTIEDEVEAIKEASNDYGFPIDGVVFKFNNVEYGKKQGQTAHHFKNAMAYKFYDETYSTELLDIEWTMGRTGVLTPVAVFDSVDIDGSEISRASLHNVSVLIETLGDKPYRGQSLEVYKANMIIPQIASAEKFDSKIMDSNSIEFIPILDKCPCCGHDIRLDSSDAGILNYVCPNPGCEGKLTNRLDHFCGKKGLDIKGLSKATLDKLIAWEWVENFKDLFSLKEYRQEWIKKPGFGEKSVDKILNAIETSKNCSLDNFIAALGIPLIGSTASKELVKYFPTWDKFICGVEQGYNFWEIPNFGVEMHNAISNFNYDEAKVLATYINFSTPTDKQPDSQEKTLDGISVVITGKLSHYKNRDEMKTAIESRGGKVVGSISGKTSYLINNDVNSTSSKNVSAKKLGIPIKSEEEFIEMFSL